MVGHGRATSPADLKSVAGSAGGHIQVPHVGEDRGVIPHLFDALHANIARKKWRFLQESTGIEVARRGNATGHFCGATHIEAFSAPILRRETEKGITRSNQVMPMEPIGEGL